MKHFLSAVLFFLLLGCDEFGGVSSPKSPVDSIVERSATIPVFTGGGEETTVEEWNYSGWCLYSDSSLAFSHNDSIIISKENITDNCITFRERIISLIGETVPTGGEYENSDIINSFTLTTNNDTILYKGTSRLLSFLNYTGKLILEESQAHLQSVDLTGDLFSLAQILENGFGTADEVTLGEYHFSDVTILCDASPTYVDGSGHCLVYQDNELKVIVTFGMSMMNGQRYQSGYLLSE